MDNFFTSGPLALSLKAKGLTIVGTLRKNKAIIPHEFLPNSKRQVEYGILTHIQYALIGFTKSGLTRLSYVPNICKAVLVWFELQGKCKPEIIHLYSYTKGHWWSASNGQTGPFILCEKKD